MIDPTLRDGSDSILSARTYGVGAYRGVRDGRYTYVRSLKGPWLLYDNVEDPYQRRNLINDLRVAAVQTRLDRELGGWLNRLSDKFLAPQEYLNRDGLAHYMEVSAPVGSLRSSWGDWHSTMDVPTIQRGSIGASLHELFSDPITGPIIMKMAPQLQGMLTIGPAAALSPKGIHLIRPALLSQRQLEELDLALQKAKQMDDMAGRR